MPVLRRNCNDRSGSWSCKNAGGVSLTGSCAVSSCFAIGLGGNPGASPDHPERRRLSSARRKTGRLRLARHSREARR
jgi:hypothetical protein